MNNLITIFWTVAGIYAVMTYQKVAQNTGLHIGCMKFLHGCRAWRHLYWTFCICGKFVILRLARLTQSRTRSFFKHTGTCTGKKLGKKNGQLLNRLDLKKIGEVFKNLGSFLGDPYRFNSLKIYLGTALWQYLSLVS